MRMRPAWSPALRGYLSSEFGLSQRPNNSGPTARPHFSLVQRARSPGENASRAEGPKQAVGTQLVPGLQPGIAQTQETYGVAIGYSVAAPLALNRYLRGMFFYPERAVARFLWFVNYPG